ncbi:hypothetical protein BUALT_Bualt04G0088600 [Buddleja alternifolia]|uniref:Uncharacterized protein n=1 Tax=Buddleja alternifolia TaxID=168488 RepID=A0AAV6XNT1_9LAMI|nr:hypothetical protein BUALT_Bualt04G0088600 [Buddleja alternifolia]
MINASVRKNLTSLFSKSYYHVSLNSAPPPTVFEFLLHRHHFSPEVASRVASAVTVLRNLQKSDALLSFLKGIGFTKSQLEKTVKSRPSLLSSSLDNTIKPKIKILQDLGLSSNDIAHIISEKPAILHTSARNRVVPALSLLKGLLGSNAEVARAVRTSGWLLVTDLEKTVRPNVEFLKSYGIAMEQIIVLMNYLPRFLLYRPKLMRKCVENVSEMGVDKSSKMFIYAVCVVGSMTKQSWDIKLQAFRNILGFSEDDISRVLKQAPLVFKVSEDKMRKVKEVVLATGKYKASCIVKCPKSVMYSIEKRFNPRFQVLEILESRHLITRWPCLGAICRMSDDKFFEQFVSPYSYEIGDVFMQRMIKR